MKKKFSLGIVAAIVLLMMCVLCPVYAEDDGAGFNSAAFSKELEKGRLSLQEVDLPGMEGIELISWVSVSPKGSYLLGQTSEGYGIYHIAEEVFVPLEIDTTNDEFHKLDRFSKLLLPQYMKAVWSPDERYFVIVNWNEVVVNGKLMWDLFVGDTRTHTVQVLETWHHRLFSGGSIYQVCFNQNSDKIYYGYCGYGNNPFDSKYMTAEFDLATKQSRPLFSNQWTDKNGEEYSCTNDGMYCTSDGCIVQIAVRKDSKDFGVSIMTPVGSEWKRNYISLVSGNTRGSNFHFSMVSDDFLAFTYTEMGENREVTAFTFVNSNYALDERNTYKYHNVGNVQISPDGDYLLSLIHSGKSYELKVYEKEHVNGRGTTVDIPFNINSNGPYLLGYNSLASCYYGGMQWGGNTLLIGTKNDVSVYQFKNTNSNIAYPWHEDDGLTGTVWSNQGPVVMTISFSEKGVCEMCLVASDLTISGEYTLLSEGNVELNFQGDVMRGVFKGNSLHLDESNEMVYFYNP